jgi:hypothetical protein
MTPVQQAQYARALKAYKDAWAAMQAYGDQALDALQKQTTFGLGSAQLFQDIAERAFQASESWRRAAELAREVMQEIAAGVPRGSEICYRCGCDAFQPSQSDPNVCVNGHIAGVACGHHKDDHI